MQRKPPDTDKRIIAESEHYYITGEWEAVTLYSKKDDRLITRAGDHYGEPQGGIIDKNERFCVTVGCGYIIYFLKEPFEPYAYDRVSEQWKEAGRDPDNINWLTAVRQISDSEIELTDENGNTEMIKIPI